MADHGGFSDDGFGDRFHRHVANDRGGFVNADKRNIADIDSSVFSRQRKCLLNAKHITQCALNPGGFRQRAAGDA